jgi:hypothetical protein
MGNRLLDGSCNKFQRPVGAGGNTGRIAPAQFTFHRLLGIYVQVYHVHGAVLDTQGAPDAFFSINLYNAVCIPCNGIDRAYLHAIGIFALAAHHGHMKKVLVFMADIQPGAPGIVSPGQIHAACQLTDAAPGAFVKMGMDKRIDGRLLVYGNFMTGKYHILCTM